MTSKDGNLLDIKETEALFEKHKPTHVIHLAALVCNLHKLNMIKHVDQGSNYPSFEYLFFTKFLIKWFSGGWPIR